MMSRLDACITAVAKDTGLDVDEVRSVAEALQKKQKLLAAEGQLGRAEKQLVHYALTHAEDEKILAAQKRSNAAKAIIVRDRLGARMADFKAGTKDDVREAILALLVGSWRDIGSGKLSANAIRNEILSTLLDAGLEGAIRKNRPHIFGVIRRETPGLIWNRNPETKFLDAVVDEMHELRPGGKSGITGNDDAKWFAELLAGVSDAGRVRANEAGAFIGKLPGWVPQRHSAAKISAAAEQDWLSDILAELDIERTFGPLADPEYVRAGLLKGREDIITGRDMGVSATERGEFVGPANMGRSLGRHRVWHFKDAQAWRRYNAKYGDGNVYTAVINHLHSVARRTSVMEVLGPNPEVMLNSVLEAERRAIRDSPTLTAKQKKKKLDSINTNLSRRTGFIGAAFAEIMGETFQPHNLTAARIGSGIRAVENVIKLGMATVTSMNDILVVAQRLRYQGMNLFEAYEHTLKAAFGGRTSADQKIIANALGSTFDGILSDIHMRFAAQDAPGGTLSRLNDAFFRMTFLTGWTNRLKAGFLRAASTLMAGNSGKAWAELDDVYRAVLGRHGIGEESWDAIRRAVSTEADGRMYILPENVDNVAASRDLMRFLANEVDRAVLMPGDRTRAGMLRGTQPGDWLGEISRFVMQFKSFPWVFSEMLHERGWRRGGKTSDLGGVAHLIAGSLILGYASMSAKDMLKGKKPRDLGKSKTWLAAMLQGGGAGIYGDFLFGAHSRFGGSVIETAAGPAAGTISDIFGVLQLAKQGDAKAGDILRVANQNTPFVNMWYTKAAFDYLVLFNLQEMASPGTLGRRERKLKKEYGQEYIYPPSSVIKRGGGFR